MLELPKTQTPTQEVKEWMELFNTGDSMSEREDFVENALNPVRKAALDEKERYWAQRAEEHRWDIDSAVHTGYEKGVEKGIQKGIEQRNEQLIRSMLQNGLEYQTILSVMGEEFAEQIKRLEEEEKR